MKHYTKLFFAAAIAALGLASCAKEVAPVETPKDNLVTVHFGATAGIEGATKATLTPNEQETLFTSAWENGNELSVEYISPETADNKIITATWTGTSFEAIGLPNETGNWDYTACYPVPDSKDSHIDFGANRTQNGNSYNSIYDVMIGNKSTKNSAAGKDDDGSNIVFNMDRKTAVVYFHLTGGPADEDLVSATLSVEGGSIASQYAHISDFAFAPTEDLKEITITFPEKAPKASDFQLWYNVLPTAYTSMSLEVKTANHTLTLNKNKGGNFVAGKLYKIHKDNVTWTENKNVTFFYESFDSCAGKGGNDGIWSSISGSSEDLKADNNWSATNTYSANACARFGTGSKLGKATTPELGINTSTATLSFKAGAWNGSSESTTINVTANNGGTVYPSTITLKKGEWTDYTCTISGATETTTLTFAASQKSNNRFFLDEVMVYYGEKPVVAKKLEQNIAFEEGNYSVLLADKDSFVSPKVKGNKTPVSYSITLGEGVAQDAITIDPITGEVTINAVGTATITATAEESEVYETASASYVLTVTEKNPTGPTTVVIDLSKQNFKNQQEIKEVSSDPVSLIFNKGSNKNSPKYFTTGTAVRLYGGNTMTVSSSKTIVKVELTFATGEDSNTITTDSETYLNGAWTGESNSIKFTVGGTSGHRRIQKVSVTYNL